MVFFCAVNVELSDCIPYNVDSFIVLAEALSTTDALTALIPIYAPDILLSFMLFTLDALICIPSISGVSIIFSDIFSTSAEYISIACSLTRVNLFFAILDVDPVFTNIPSLPAPFIILLSIAAFDLDVNTIPYFVEAVTVLPFTISFVLPDNCIPFVPALLI